MRHPLDRTTRRTPSERAAVITSKENQWLKRYRAALAGERNAPTELVGLEGAKLIETALDAGLQVESILASESGERHLSRLGHKIPSAARILRTTDRLFASVSETRTPQGVAALVHARTVSLDDLFRGTALIAVLVGVQDPGNVGTILRAAEIFGATGAATCPAGAMGTASPFAPKALRASAGSALTLPILPGISSTILLAQLRVAGVTVFAAVPAQHAAAEHSDAALPGLLAPWQVNWKEPSALLIGNEGAGLPFELVKSADARVSIPQSARRNGAGPESLNAAIAAAVLLYEASRQRRGVS